jgi:hypothetical protein
MDPAGGPDAKKARWSPNASFPGSNGANSAVTPTRDAFANYGYGPQANISQNGFNGSPPPSGSFAGSPLYSTPSLGPNSSVNGNGMAPPLSPNTAAAFAQQQQQQQQQQQNQVSVNGGAYGGFGAYNMLGMGIPAMNMLGGFPYNGQMANFSQVCSRLLSGRIPPSPLS